MITLLLETDDIFGPRLCTSQLVHYDQTGEYVVKGLKMINPISTIVETLLAGGWEDVWEGDVNTFVKCIGFVKKFHWNY